MASKAKMGPQDMPPKGGYGPIQIERIKLRSIISAPATIAAFVASQFIGFYIYGLTVKQVDREDIEMRSARFAMLPMLMAERDRAFLKQVRKNRDEERELMKNDPDWDVGTYYNEPIYITRPEGEFTEPTFQEFYAHASWTESMARRMLRRHMC
ncbi:NADH dehydrogenase [ubiquinone] 1 alpha subcomplex subunit 13 [Leptopilina boulardi]|uniref:NADH dehydrogenase [ubiquinone] 1 alpha subcomplex subunit 13 n=1 Tax=Leptopilina boulardi TaxID=63433 RepID=UPI0021F51F78|nr:NADH dehydrogenase [ubiquinone] 1 alpha subcomplex subunit 13 [Leptopilina boulardi]